MGNVDLKEPKQRIKGFSTPNEVSFHVRITLLKTIYNFWPILGLNCCHTPTFRRREYELGVIIGANMSSLVHPCSGVLLVQRWVYCLPYGRCSWGL